MHFDIGPSLFSFIVISREEVKDVMNFETSLLNI